MFLKEFLYFPKSDRRVVVFLLIVAVAAGLALFFWGGKEAPSDANTSAAAMQQSNDSTQGRTRWQRNEASGTASKDYRYDEGELRRERFPFDPNTADSTTLLRLGLRPWQVRNIYKYRAKGGVYRQPADFAQVYGLTLKEYRELEPYIRISDDYRPASLTVKQTSEKAPRDTTLYPHKLQEGQTVSLNTADTTLLKKVPGIGPYFARNIVSYRTRLGGFADVAQLLEIEGFPEEALPYFTVDAGAVRKIHVNDLTVAQLHRHPYFNFYQARAIADFRRLKRSLKDIDDLRQLRVFTEKEIERLLPYLTFE